MQAEDRGTVELGLEEDAGCSEDRTASTGRKTTSENDLDWEGGDRSAPEKGEGAKNAAQGGGGPRGRGDGEHGCCRGCEGEGGSMMLMRIAVVLIPVLFLLSFPSAAGAQPVHGNWCGAEHYGGPTTSALDEACKQHDECYDARGSADCKCDEALLSRAESIATSTKSEQERAAALAVAAYFRISPCSIVSKKDPLPLRVVGAVLSPVTGLIKKLF